MDYLLLVVGIGFLFDLLVVWIYDLIVRFVRKVTADTAT